MIQIEYDHKALELKLIRAITEFFLEDVTPVMPMVEIRARADLIGTMYSRAVTVCLHEGPIGADIALKLRAAEQFGRENAQNSMEVFMPGGKIREMWSDC